MTAEEKTQLQNAIKECEFFLLNNGIHSSFYIKYAIHRHYLGLKSIEAQSEEELTSRIITP